MCCWMCLNLCFCFFSRYFYTNYEFCKELKTGALTAGIKMYKSIIKIIKKKKKKRNKKFKDLNCPSKILIYLQNNVTLLFEVQKKY